MGGKNPKINFFLINHYFSQQEEHISKGKQGKGRKKQLYKFQGNILTQNLKSTPVQNRDLFTAYHAVLSSSYCTSSWLMTL